MDHAADALCVIAAIGGSCPAGRPLICRYRPAPRLTSRSIFGLPRQMSFFSSSLAIQRATSLAAGVPDRGSRTQWTLTSMRAAGRAVIAWSSRSTADSIAWDT